MPIGIKTTGNGVHQLLRSSSRSNLQSRACLRAVPYSTSLNYQRHLDADLDVIDCKVAFVPVRMTSPEIVNAASQDVARLANDTRKEGHSISELREAAAQDASRILIAHPSYISSGEDSSLRNSNATGVNLDTITTSEAKLIMSEEHKSLGYRPPPESLAAADRPHHAVESFEKDASNVSDVSSKSAAEMNIENMMMEEEEWIMGEFEEEWLMSGLEGQHRPGHEPPNGESELLDAKVESAATVD